MHPCSFRIRRYPGERLPPCPGEAGAGRKVLEYGFGTGMWWEGWKHPLEGLSVGLCRVTCAVPARGDVVGEFSQRCFLLFILMPPSWVMDWEILEFVAGETQGRVTHRGQGWGREDRDSRVQVTLGLCVAHEGQPKITELPRIMKNRESC